MTDGIIKGTGNSRYLKSVANALTLYPTHESLMEALAAGTLPIDLNGINPAGWETQGTALNKANLLTDALCTALGLANTATPTQAMDKLREVVSGKINISAGSYTGTGAASQTIYFPGPAKAVILANAYGETVQYDSPRSYFGGIVLPNNPLQIDSVYANITNKVVASISGSSLNVRYDYNKLYGIVISSNRENMKFYYVCFY